MKAIDTQHAGTITQLENLLDRMLRAGSKWLKEHPSKRLGFSMFEYETPRTPEQNAFLWVLHELRAAHVNTTWPERAAAMIAVMHQAGVPLSMLERSALLHKTWNKNDMHEEFKKKYLGGKSSTKRGKWTMSEAITAYMANMQQEEGIEIPEDSRQIPTEDAA